MNKQAHRQAAFTLLDKLFNSPNPSDWGGRGYLVDTIARRVGVSKRLAEEFHTEWADARDDEGNLL